MTLQRFAADVLHDDARTVIERVDFVDRADERVIESGSGARLAEQLLQDVGLARRGDELERDLAVEHHVIRVAEFSHASAADDFDDPIAGLGHYVECH